MSRVARLALVAVAALFAAACASDAATVESEDSVVTIFGPFRGVEAERFLADLQPWASEKGIELRYTGSGNLATDLQSRVAESALPDLAVVPQPGLVESLSRDGVIVPLPDPVAAATEAAIPAPFADLARIDGELAGIPVRVAIKGLVFYRPDVFADLGVEVPRSLAQLRALVLELQDEGQPAWCFGIEAQRATGWAATDWIENLVVRQSGPEVYRAWTDGTVGFADPRIEDSFDWFGSTVLQPRRVAGGVNGVLSTPVQSASTPLFADPPGCVLYQQASFALSWFPDGTTIGPEGDVDFFLLPGTDADQAPPVVVGADTVVAFRDRPEVEAVLAHLTMPASVDTWVRSGGFLSPLSAVDDDRYPDDERLIDERLADVSSVVVDASDAMAPEIGTDALLTGITAWVAGADDYDEFATTLDELRSTPDR